MTMSLKQRKIKLEPRIRLNHNTYPSFDFVLEDQAFYLKLVYMYANKYMHHNNRTLYNDYLIKGAIINIYIYFFVLPGLKGP